MHTERSETACKASAATLPHKNSTQDYTLSTHITYCLDHNRHIGTNNDVRKY